MEVVVWWSGAPLLLQDLDDLIEMMEPWILLFTKSLQGECPANSSFPEAQEHLSYAAG